MFLRRSLSRCSLVLNNVSTLSNVYSRVQPVQMTLCRLGSSKPRKQGRSDTFKPSATSNSFNIQVVSNDGLGNPVTNLKVAHLVQPQEGTYQSHGVLRNLPLIPTAEELKATCISRSRSLKVAKYVTGEKEKSKDQYLRKLTVTTEFVLYRLDKQLHVIPANCSWLHPLERTIVGLTLGKDLEWDEEVDVNSDIFQLHTKSGEAEFEQVVKLLKKQRNKIASEFERYEKQQKACRSKEEVDEVFAVGSEAQLEQISGEEGTNVLHTCRTIIQRLRDTNSIDPYAPTIALVGAPNVGKSSLVKVLSSGKPEIQNYPFTTRSIICGHMDQDLYGDGSSVKVQVTDTPGLLDRPDKHRRRMEMLTLAVLEHQKQVLVIFVYDPAGLSGTSLESQFRLRQELRWRYHKLIPNMQWFDVATKADLWKLTSSQREQRETEYQEKLDRLWIKLQAEKINVTEGRVVAEMQAVEEKKEHHDVMWDLEFHQKMKLFDVFGDVVLDRVEKQYRDDKGEVIPMEKMEEVLYGVNGRDSSVHKKSDDNKKDKNTVHNTPNMLDIPFVVNSIPLVPSDASVDHDWSLQTALNNLPPRPKHFTEGPCHTFEVSTARSHDWASEELFWRKAFGLEYDPFSSVPMSRIDVEGEKLIFGLDETVNTIARQDMEDVVLEPLQLSVVEDEYNVRALKQALKQQLKIMLHSDATDSEKE